MTLHVPKSEARARVKKWARQRRVIEARDRRRREMAVQRGRRRLKRSHVKSRNAFLLIMEMIPFATVRKLPDALFDEATRAMLLSHRELMDVTMRQLRVTNALMGLGFSLQWATMYVEDSVQFGDYARAQREFAAANAVLARRRRIDEDVGADE